MAEPLPLAVGLAEAEEEAMAEPLPLAVGLAEADSVTVAVAVGVAVSVTVGVAEGAGGLDSAGAPPLIPQPLRARHAPRPAASPPAARRRIGADPALRVWVLCCMVLPFAPEPRPR